MADPFLAEVYPGCTVEVTDPVAFLDRNPLRTNPLLALKDDACVAPWDAHHNVPGNADEARLDICVRCNPYGFGPLCDRHRDQLTEVTPCEF